MSLLISLTFIGVFNFFIPNFSLLRIGLLLLQECSTFLAGDAIRSCMRNAKLDIRGVFGSVCRHEFPLLFMDMKHAERYSDLLYSYFIGAVEIIEGLFD